MDRRFYTYVELKMHSRKIKIIIAFFFLGINLVVGRTVLIFFFLTRMTSFSLLNDSMSYLDVSVYR